MSLEDMKDWEDDILIDQDWQSRVELPDDDVVVPEVITKASKRKPAVAPATSVKEEATPSSKFAYTTGWRIPSEVLTLQWSQVDFLAQEVCLYPHTTKNDEPRAFPFTDELRALLRDQYSATRQLEVEKKAIIPWVFHRHGNRLGSFYKAWARACMEAGLPVTIHYKRDTAGEVIRYKQTQKGRKKGEPVIQRIEAQSIPHDFRRTAVRNLVRAGVPEAVAMKMTGHKTRSVFERYNIVSPQDLREAAKRLNTVLGTVSGTNAPNVGTHATENSANLLHFNDGPVAQKDRAAVS